MRKRSVIYIGVAMLAGAMGGALLGPAPVGAVAREIVELQQSVNQLIQGQQALQTAITQNEAVEKTLIEQSTRFRQQAQRLPWAALQKTVQDMQATSGARLDTMSTQVQGVSDNLAGDFWRVWASSISNSPTRRMPSRASTPSWPAARRRPHRRPRPAHAESRRRRPRQRSLCRGLLQDLRRRVPCSSGEPGSRAAPSADLLYSNGLRDLNGRKYDLAAQEFQDYLKYYALPIWPRTRSSIWARLPTRRNNIDQAVDAYGKVIDNYPKSFKLAPAHLKRGLALIQLGREDLRRARTAHGRPDLSGHRRRTPRPCQAAGTGRNSLTQFRFLPLTALDHRGAREASASRFAPSLTACYLPAREVPSHMSVNKAILVGGSGAIPRRATPPAARPSAISPWPPTKPIRIVTASAKSAPNGTASSFGASRRRSPSNICTRAR